MIPFLSQADSLAARTRSAWVWLGQVGLVVLGIHGAADRIDDYVVRLMVALQVSWVEHQFVLDASTWVAVAIELGVVVWALWTRLRAQASPIRDPRDWWSRRSIQAAIAAFSWLPLSLAGCWVVAIAIEDRLAVWLPGIAIYVGLVVAVLVAWRLGLTGWVRIVRQTPIPKRALEGWPWMLPVGFVAALALRFGLPIWGWMS